MVWQFVSINKYLNWSKLPYPRLENSLIIREISELQYFPYFRHSSNKVNKQIFRISQNVISWIGKIVECRYNIHLCFGNERLLDHIIPCANQTYSEFSYLPINHIVFGIDHDQGRLFVSPHHFSPQEWINKHYILTWTRQRTLFEVTWIFTARNAAHNSRNVISTQVLYTPEFCTFAAINLLRTT